jgi:type II secretory pathway component PulM
MTGFSVLVITNRLAALTARERRLLAVGALVLAGSLVAFGIWQPLLAHRLAETARLHRNERNLAALTQMPVAAKVKSDPRPVASILTQTAAAQNLTILRLDTPKEGATTVTLQGAVFDTLILWIDGLDRDNGLVVTSATIRRSDAPGIVSADLSLQKAVP